MSTFIETQFPIARLSAEAYKERKANNSQMLTRLGKWWGRKPLILVGSSILGTLMPATTHAEVGISDLLGQLRDLIAQVRHIVEFEHDGRSRAAYGAGFLGPIGNAIDGRVWQVLGCLQSVQDDPVL